VHTRDKEFGVLEEDVVLQKVFGSSICLRNQEQLIYLQKSEVLSLVETYYLFKGFSFGLFLLNEMLICPDLIDEIEFLV
jgi:hypothetical protein